MFPFEAAPARLHDDPVALAQAPQERRLSIVRGDIH
jgi:hypothetical protein